MELSVEEAMDLILEIIGCGIVVTLLALWLHHSQFITIMERMI